MLRELRARVQVRHLLLLVKHLLELACEFGLTWCFLTAYNITRNKFGSSQEGSLEVAKRHALDVLAVEHAIGIDWEERIQAAALHMHGWIRFWNIFYGSAHMAVTVFVLLFLFALRPVAYQRCRSSFMLMNLVAITGYALYPLMPPRLMPTCDDIYGGCLKSFSYVDTLQVYGGLWSWKNKVVSKVSNQYAAMPSMHAGYSLWCSVSMYEHSPFLPLRVAFVLYPLCTLYCISVTANHFLLDAVVGAACWVAGHLAAPYMPRFGRGAPRGLDAVLAKYMPAWFAVGHAVPTLSGKPTIGSGGAAAPLMGVHVQASDNASLHPGRAGGGGSHGTQGQVSSAKVSALLGNGVKVH